MSTNILKTSVCIFSKKVANTTAFTFQCTPFYPMKKGQFHFSYKDMATVGEDLQTWKLKLSTTKTVSAAFHLNNKEAKSELKVNFNNETLPFCCEPKYLGVTLDKLLTYRWHLESLRKKLTSRVALMRRLAGSGWGPGATTLRTATLALVHSTAEYCAPV